MAQLTESKPLFFLFLLASCQARLAAGNEAAPPGCVLFKLVVSGQRCPPSSSPSETEGHHTAADKLT